MNKMHKLKGTVLDIQINLASSSLKIWLTNWRQMKYIRACTVDEALELAKIKQPDVIFLKVFMPISGFKIYEILQQNQDTKHIPVVFYNARNPDVEKKMKESGIPYIFNPHIIDLDELFECLATYLEVVED